MAEAQHESITVIFMLTNALPDCKTLQNAKHYKQCSALYQHVAAQTGGSVRCCICELIEVFFIATSCCMKLLIVPGEIGLISGLVVIAKLDCGY